ncbi:hypothetical protein CF319_g2696 [Tilletia indica]|nr:hypothetical protein CF319_g2696 [Tilletia indica]
MSSLLDTGASLSVIDRNLLEVLEGTAQGTPMPIHGLGNASSLGWCTIPFFIDARDDRGRDVSLECKVDFHVVEAFAPGLCLGQDFISTHSIAIHCRRGTAELQQGGRTFTFRVHEHMFAPFAPQAELCTTRDVVVRARSHVWVPVDTGSLAPGLYYAAFPRLGVNEAESRRTPVADAVVAQLGDVGVHSAHTFELPALASTVAVHSAAATAPAPDETAAQPLDMVEESDGFGLVDPAVEAETTLVDGPSRWELTRPESLIPLWLMCSADIPAHLLLKAGLGG